MYVSIYAIQEVTKMFLRQFLFVIMVIDIIVIGKTNFQYVIDGVETFNSRIKRYINFNIITIPDVKNAKSLSEGELKVREGEILLSYFKKYDHVVLLDERGKEYSSEDFSVWLNKRMISGIKRLCFVVGGAYGFSQEVYSVANEKISLSKMTFSHQMIRILIVEQIYRAFTILNGEPYHHK